MLESEISNRESSGEKSQKGSKVERERGVREQRVASQEPRLPTPHSPLPTPGPRSGRSEATVFVYGTLKRGQSNHERFCQDALSIETATIGGRLYELPYGFPALVVPDAEIRATGTTNYLTDAGKQLFLYSAAGAPPSGWDTVYGELMSFDDPEERLAALDALEGYVPGEKGLYERVLIPVEATEVVLAWVYRVERADGVYLPGGCWPAS